MNIRLTNLSTYAKSTYLMLVLIIVISLAAGLAYAASPEPDEPKAVISAQASEYTRTASPVFNIQTGSNKYYKVQLALNDSIFNWSDTDSYKITTGDRQNFYSTDWLECSDEENITFAASAETLILENGECTFTLTSTVWSNLRASVVFYRLITNSSESDAGALISKIGSVGRTGETWYGFPLNDKATVSRGGNTFHVIVNGEINGYALESDYGPRNVSGGSKFHPGLDFSVVVGTPVYAIDDGEVIDDPVYYDDDHILVIDHNGSNRTGYVGYVHLDKWLVETGDDVSMGQLIGYSGDWMNGQHKSAHLHVDSGRTRAKYLFHNPFNYLEYTSRHTITTGTETFLVDANTQNNLINIVKAEAGQPYALVAFGITTGHDKDLNFVQVQVDNRKEDGQFFELDYDQVDSQSSSTGVVTLKNGKTFLVWTGSVENLYKSPDLIDYLFYVKPIDTYTNTVAKDYFFFRWNMAPFQTNDDGGPHTIQVKLREVESTDYVTHSLTIGPEITLDEGPTIDGNMISYKLLVTNHDYQAGDITLTLKGKPEGWTSNFNGDTMSVPNIPKGGSQIIVLTLTAPDGDADPEILNALNTRVVATFDRIPALKDTVELCPNVWIDSPEGGAEFKEGDAVPVTVKIRSGLTATDVKLSIADGMPIPMTHQGNNTWTYQWTAPQLSEYAKEFSLQAIATIQGVSGDVYSDIIKVIVKEKSESKFVWINKPAENEKVSPGNPYTVEVQTSPAASSVTLTVFEEPSHTQITVLTLTPVNSNNLLWTANCYVPDKETDYSLIAEGIFSDGNQSSGVRNITAEYPQIDPIPVVFINPLNGNQDLKIGETIKVTVEAKDDPAKNVDVERVTLIINPSDFGAGGDMLERGLGSGTWDLNWTPQPPAGVEEQNYHLTAIAKNANGEEVGRSEIDVKAKGGNPVDPEFITADPLYTGIEQEIIVNAPGANNVVLYFDNVAVPLKQSGPNWIFTWTPGEAYIGWHELKAIAYYQGGTPKTITRTITVKEAPITKIEQINPYALLATIEDVKHKSVPTYVPLVVSSTDYTCGIAGYYARGGDIGEKYYEWDPGQTIRAYITPNGSIYQLMLDINTWNHYGVWPFDDWEGRPETWDVKVLCVKKELVSIWSPLRYEDYLFDDIPVDTSIPYDEKVCMIGGFFADQGDINENGAHDIIEMYTFRQQGNWYVKTDFATHNDGEKNKWSGKERRIRWDVDLMCLNSDVASVDGPLPNKVFFVKEYFDLGDNVGAKRSIDTGFSTADYTCGIAGFAARDGDIDEGNYEGTNTNLLSAYMYPDNGSWHIRADFRTHHDDEDWDVNVICALNDGGTPVQWNASHEETEDENCVGSGTKCQVLRFEGITSFATKYQDFIVVGGGYDVSPSSFNTKCSSSADIEVYEDLREPGTDRLQWSEDWAKPSTCVQSGDVLRFYANRTYDLRGVSLVGGETRPFRLVDPDAPPTNLSAKPVLFTTRDANNVLYGPGMALTWDPTVHPQAVYYEIQFSEDRGTTWQILDNQRPTYHGGWRNHHGGNVKCGHGFGRCLKRNQTYSYRVRVLDSSRDPLTDWSNVVSATSMEWPAHIGLDTPNPPGDPPGYYPNGATVEIKIDPQETFGKSLELSWQIIPFSTATYTILDNTCATGSLQNSKATTCKLRINRGSSSVSQSEAASKLAALEPVPSLKVIVKGEHTLKDQDDIEVLFSHWDDVYLYFQQGGDLDTTFSDVPEEHWAYPYITYLNDNGFVSGCSVTGESMFCPEEPITREQQAVILVRAEHPQEPGYVPNEVEPVIVPFIDVQDKMAVESVESASAAPASYWAGKWIAELYDLGLTSGCSEDPPRYCPDMPVTRAQMAVFAVKLHMGQDFKPGDPPYQPFNDVTLYDENGGITWQARWVLAAKVNGLVQNCGTDMEGMVFRPNEPATRAEMACMVYHALTNEWNTIVPPG